MTSTAPVVSGTDGPPAVEPGPSAVVKRVPAKGSEPPRAARLQELTERDIENVTGQNRAAFYRCFEAHQKDLPSDQGQITVTFSVLGSGQVSHAQVEGPFAGTQVGQCLVQRISALKFPKNASRETRLGLPLAYRKR
jgi:hypothetical protein